MLSRKQRNKLINLVRTYRVKFDHEFVMESLAEISDSREEIVAELSGLLDDPVADNDHAATGILRLLCTLRYVDGQKALLAALQQFAKHESESVRSNVVVISSLVLQQDERTLSKEHQHALRKLAETA